MQEKLEVSILYDVTIPYLDDYSGYDSSRLVRFYFSRTGVVPLKLRDKIPPEIINLYKGR